MCHVVDVNGIYYHCKQRNLCCAVSVSAEMLADKKKVAFQSMTKTVEIYGKCNQVTLDL